MAPSIITAFHQTVHQHHLAPSDWQWNLLRAPSDLDAVLHDLSHWDWGKAWRDIGGAGALGAVGGTVEIGFKGWPGVKGGATFLSTLRENIQLSTLDAVHNLPPSPYLHPRQSPPSHSVTGPPHLSGTPPDHTPKRARLHSRSGSATAAAAAACLLTMTSSPAPASSSPRTDEPPPLPELTTHLSTSVEERPAILKIVADSIAQQRQIAATSLIFHPASIFLLGIVLALQAQYLNPATLLTTFAGTVMAFLVGVRGYTSGYIVAAENVDSWEWLVSDTAPSAQKQRPPSSSSSSSSHGANPPRRTRKGSNDSTHPAAYQVYVTYWGSELIGALVLRISKRDRTAYVRAWTVKNKYRRKGVGRALLEGGVKGVMGLSALPEGSQNGPSNGSSSGTGTGNGNGNGNSNGFTIGKIKTVELDNHHTGCLRIFPETVINGMIPLGLNRRFEKREENARRVIEEVVDEVVKAEKKVKGRR